MEYGESTSFEYNGKSFTRYHINFNGHSLFDTLSFLYLFCKKRDTSMQKTKCWFEKKGWLPKIETLTGDDQRKRITAKGNLLDIMIANESDMMKEILLYLNKELKDTNFSFLIDDIMNRAVRAWQNRNVLYKEESPTDHLNIEVAGLLFPLMFDIGRYKCCVFRKAAYDNSSRLFCLNPYETWDCEDNHTKNTLYIWFTGSHFEPVLET